METPIPREWMLLDEKNYTDKLQKTVRVKRPR